MIEVLRCEICGSPLTQGGPLASNCPRCLFSLASESESGGDDPIRFLDLKNKETLRDPPVIGRYRVVRLVSEGGMGAVYEARQEYPHRTVALKLIKPGLASLEMLRRFEQESQALGRLQHPGIAQIYEAGTSDTGYGPQPFFAMEFIYGKTLLEYAETHRLSTRERLEIFARVCDAVQHAHQRGLIHRDLKPGNILVDETGQPKVLDFGVARLTDSDTQTTLHTGMGQLVGTLAYMSPEQALADPLELDTRSDVYALGVILYELLSARLPYRIGKTVPEALQAIREEDPARLSSISRTYRGDIETIVARALEKVKSRRYSSAAELASDIRRHLRDEPIVARPASVSYQVQKFARRHKAVVGSVVAVFLALAAGIVATTWMAVRARNAEQLALKDRDHARRAEAEASMARDRAEAAEAAVSVQRDIAVRAGTEAMLERNRAAVERDHITWQSLARESVRLSTSRGDSELAALLARQAFVLHARTPDEPRYLVEEALQQAVRQNPESRRLTGHDGTVNSITFSSDGNRLVSGSTDRTVRIWNLNAPNTPSYVIASGDESVNAVALSPDGVRVASSAYREVKVWNVRDPGASPLVPTGRRPGTVAAFAFSPDGKTLAIADFNGFWLWDWRNPGAVPMGLPGPRLSENATLPFTSVSFSPDGRRVAGGDLFGGVRVWDLRTPTAQPLVLRGHPARVNSVAFAPDGRHLASVGDPTEADPRPDVRIWDLDNTSAAPMLLPGQESPAASVAFSQNGKLATAGQDGIVRLWNSIQQGVKPLLLPGHDGAARAVTFSADSTRLASAGNDYSIRLWDLRDDDVPFRPFKAHQASVESLEFSPNGSHLATGSADRTARVWDLRDRTVPALSFQHDDVVRVLTFSSDGVRLASGTMGTVRVWNMPNPGFQPLVLRDQNGFQSIRFARDNTLVTTTLRNSLIAAVFNGRGATPPLVPAAALKRWNLQTGASQVLLRDDRIGDDLVAITDDWSRLAAGPGDGSIWVWDLHRPERAPIRLAGHYSFLLGMTFETGGTRVASAGADNNVRVWDLANPNTPELIIRSSAPGRFVRFLFENTRLVAGGPGSQETRLWDLRAPFVSPIVFKGGSATIRSAAVSRDGTRLALGAADGNVWVWNLWTAAADELCTRVTRNLTLEEWRFYVGQSIPYMRTCPSLPDGKGVSDPQRADP